MKSAHRFAPSASELSSTRSASTLSSASACAMAGGHGRKLPKLPGSTDGCRTCCYRRGVGPPLIGMGLLQKNAHLTMEISRIWVGHRFDKGEDGGNRAALKWIFVGHGLADAADGEDGGVAGVDGEDDGIWIVSLSPSFCPGRIDRLYFAEELATDSHGRRSSTKSGASTVH
ncbi:hypothetical protein ACLOJK_011553 [Asimina triloba]